MRLHSALAALTALALAAVGLQALAQSPPPTPAAANSGARTPEMPLRLQRFKLPNGLDVLLAEDRRLPQVALNLWVHAGPREERPGQTGYAYLFEHLMFNGSRHIPRGSADALVNAAGGTDFLGNTNFDRSSYSLTLPSHQLELGLWVQADMLGWMLDGVDAGSLAAQQAVIRNDRRQNAENRPYGIVDEAVYAALFPPGHPYRAAVIGSHADIQAFRVDAVRDFARSHYRPNNATLVVAGDIDPARARALVQRYFGSLKAGPPVPPVQVQQPAIDTERQVVVSDAVDLPRVTLAWHTPAVFQPGDAELDLAASILGGGSAGRLYRTLIEDRRLAQSIDVSQYSLSLGSVFTIEVVARPGRSLDEVQAALDEELALLANTPPSDAELQRAVAGSETRLFHRLEKLSGLAEQLNLYQRFAANASFLDRDLARYRQASPEAVRAAVARHLRTNARVVVRGIPGPQALAPDVPVPPSPQVPAQAQSDGRMALNLPEPWRAVPPPAGQPAPILLQDGLRQQLPNGLMVVHVPRPGVPLVSATLVLRAGLDRTPADRPGLANFTAAMLDQGTRQRSAAELADTVAALGASVAIDFGAEDVRVSVAAMASRLPAALDLVADMVLRPDFPPEALARQKLLRLAALQRQRQNPASIADVVARAAFYGPDHPLAASRLGDDAAISSTTRTELRAFWRANYRPDEAALVVSGDVDQATLLRLAQQAFGSWRAPLGNSPEWQPAAPRPSAARVVLVDQPGAALTLLQLIAPGPRADAPDAAAATVLNAALAGGAGARLPAALRALQGQAGAGALSLGRSQASWVQRASVPTAATAAAVAALLQQLKASRDDPLPAEELLRARSDTLLALPAEFDTNDAVSLRLARAWALNLPGDHMARWPQQLAAVNAGSVLLAARQHLDPQQLLLVAVGDVQQWHAAVQALGLGAVELRDVDGRLVPGAPGVPGAQGAKGAQDENAATALLPRSAP